MTTSASHAKKHVSSMNTFERGGGSSRTIVTSSKGPAASLDLPASNPLPPVPVFETNRALGREDEKKFLRLIDGLLRLPDLLEDDDGLGGALTDLKCYLKRSKEVRV